MTDSRPQSSTADTSELAFNFVEMYWGTSREKAHEQLVTLLAAERQRWVVAAREQLLANLPPLANCKKKCSKHEGYDEAIKAIRAALATVPGEQTANEGKQ